MNGTSQSCRHQQPRCGEWPPQGKRRTEGLGASGEATRDVGSNPLTTAHPRYGSRVPWHTKAHARHLPVLTAALGTCCSVPRGGSGSDRLSLPAPGAAGLLAPRAEAVLVLKHTWPPAGSCVWVALPPTPRLASACGGVLCSLTWQTVRTIPRKSALSTVTRTCRQKGRSLLGAEVCFHGEGQNARLVQDQQCRLAGPASMQGLCSSILFTC